MDDITLRLIANPTKLKKKDFYIKNEYLKLYLNDIFKTDNITINNLIIYIEHIVNDINLDDIKNEYLKLYLNDIFKTDNITINNLTIYIENIIKNINMNTFIINETLQDIISTIENESIY